MIKLSADLDMDELVEQLCSQLDAQSLIDLIKLIDTEVDTYEFTDELKEYFVEEIRMEDGFPEDSEE